MAIKKQNIVAKRYARALFDVCKETKNLETIKKELDNILVLLKNKEIASFFSNPSFSINEKDQIMNEIISKVKCSPVSTRFLGLMIQSRRFNIIDQIIDNFIILIEEELGMARAMISAASIISDKVKTQLESGLAEITKKKIIPTYSIDEKLLNGIIAEVGSLRIDGSLKTQMEHLKNYLLQETVH